MFGLVLIAGAASTVWALWNDPSLREFPSEIHLVPLLLGFTIKLVNSFLGAGIWVMLFRGIGGRIGLRDGMRIYLVTSVAKYVPGKVTLVVARVAMLKSYGQSAAHGISSTVLELGFSLLVAALVAVLVAPLLPWAGDLKPLLVGLGIVALAAGLVVLHPRVVGPLLQRGQRLLPRWITDAMSAPPPYATTLKVLGANVLLRLAGAFGLYGVVQSVYPLDASWIPLLAGASAIGYLFGFVLPLAPAGLGARDGMMTLLLSAIVPLPIAAAISVLDRLAGVLSELAAAGVMLAFARLWGTPEALAPLPAAPVVATSKLP